MRVLRDLSALFSFIIVIMFLGSLIPRFFLYFKTQNFSLLKNLYCQWCVEAYLQRIDLQIYLEGCLSVPDHSLSYKRWSLCFHGNCIEWHLEPSSQCEEQGQEQSRIPARRGQTHTHTLHPHLIYDGANSVHVINIHKSIIKEWLGPSLTTCHESCEQAFTDRECVLDEEIDLRQKPMNMGWLLITSLVFLSNPGTCPILVSKSPMANTMNPCLRRLMASWVTMWIYHIMKGRTFKMVFLSVCWLDNLDRYEILNSAEVSYVRVEQQYNILVCTKQLQFSTEDREGVNHYLGSYFII